MINKHLIDNKRKSLFEISSFILITFFFFTIFEKFLNLSSIFPFLYFQEISENNIFTVVFQVLYYVLLFTFVALILVVPIILVSYGLKKPLFSRIIPKTNNSKLNFFLYILFSVIYISIIGFIIIFIELIYSVLLFVCYQLLLPYINVNSKIYALISERSLLNIVLCIPCIFLYIFIGTIILVNNIINYFLKKDNKRINRSKLFFNLSGISYIILSLLLIIFFTINLLFKYDNFNFLYKVICSVIFNKSSIIIAIFIVIVNIIDFCIKNKSKKAL